MFWVSGFFNYVTTSTEVKTIIAKVQKYSRQMNVHWTLINLQMIYYLIRNIDAFMYKITVAARRGGTNLKNFMY